MTTPILTAAPGVGGSYQYNPNTGLMELIEFTEDPQQHRPPGFDVVAHAAQPDIADPVQTPQSALKVDLPPQE